jgi:hypothetical protein
MSNQPLINRFYSPLKFNDNHDKQNKYNNPK